jgi:2'-5' RNA ligase
MRRLFIAIDIIPDSNFCDIYAKLKSTSTKLDKINWVKPDLMHLTLKFLGETPENKIPAIVKEIKSASFGISSFELKIGTIGAFGSRYQPRVLWFGIDKSEPLEQIHTQIQKEIRKLGFKPDFGNFVPHITLARINKIDDKQKFWKSIESLQTPFIQEIKVNKIILYESILNERIPVYEVVEEISEFAN